MKTYPMKRQNTTAVTVSFRCPEDVYRAAEKVLRDEDIDFSKLVRRALKNELSGKALTPTPA